VKSVASADPRRFSVLTFPQRPTVQTLTQGLESSYHRNLEVLRNVFGVKQVRSSGYELSLDFATCGALGITPEKARRYPTKFGVTRGKFGVTPVEKPELFFWIARLIFWNVPIRESAITNISSSRAMKSDYVNSVGFDGGNWQREPAKTVVKCPKPEGPNTTSWVFNFENPRCCISNRKK